MPAVSCPVASVIAVRKTHPHSCERGPAFPNSGGGGLASGNEKK